jgi:hypothetical protein
MKYAVEIGLLVMRYVSSFGHSEGDVEGIYIQEGDGMGLLQEITLKACTPTTMYLHYGLTAYISRPTI